MINPQTLEGNWNEIQGKIRQRWGQLTDEDLTQFHGRVDQLVGAIQRKTGEGREAIENYLSELSSSAGSAAGWAAENFRPYAQRAADTMQDVAKQTGDQLRAGYIQAERFVRERPRESLLIFLGRISCRRSHRDDAEIEIATTAQRPVCTWAYRSAVNGV